MASEVYVAFLWHMHQPWYALPGTTVNLLPWTRLRTTKDYTDMASFISRGNVPVTVNFTPCLTEQLRCYAAGTLSDGYSPSTATDDARRDLLSGAAPLPLSRRGFPTPDLDRLRAEAARPEGERTLWGWFLLSWIAQSVLDADPALKALASRGRFTDGDLEELLDLHRRLLGEVLPRYRGLAEKGLIELTTTPFYHPILPLLIDTSVARRAQPEDPVPPFSSPDDAQEQVDRALRHHALVFGDRPLGMWPAEGAVSPEAAELLARAGVRWIAADGEILARSLGRPPSPEDLYRPWRFPTVSGDLFILFRDTYLSNLISFDCHRWPAEEAAADLIRRLRAVGAAWQGANPPLVLIAMDGENAWDFYDRNGQPFFDALYGRFREETSLIPTTVSGYIGRFEVETVLRDLWSGSWIDADFRTWIGHLRQNEAWSLLCNARRAAAACPSSSARERARDHLLVAEGSDWFWWYGPHHSAPHEPVFDRLFRGHVAQVYVEIGRPVPASLAL